MPRPTMLINWGYYFAVGHVVEALKIAHGYVAKMPDLEVHLILPQQAPADLARASPAVSRVYTVNPYAIAQEGESSIALACIPRVFDYVVEYDFPEGPAPPAIAPFAELFERRFLARRWKGSSNDRYVLPEGGQPEYDFNATVSLTLPDAARFASPMNDHRGPKIALLLAGGGGAGAYPSLGFWQRMCAAIRREFPDVRFALTGQSGAERRGTYTSSYPRAAVNALFDADAELVDAYDIGLWRQLGLIAECDMLISPHTGFSFLAPCVGTPWLALSGGHWSEYLMNGRPFYCVLPRCERYPCRGFIKPECRVKYGGDDYFECMSDRALEPKIAEIVAGVRKLKDPSFSYEMAVAEHLERVQKGTLRHDAFRFFDWWQAKD
ncbi:MAG: hypothetical protein IT381_02090 [Deltaproteobacteria bacterium]|nr:hypothetical protein [Deltaproteobacteria bacterium]